MEVDNSENGTNGVSKTLTNVESDAPQKLPYPKRVFFIISNEFCERFNFYGMKTILVFYMRDKLGYESNTASMLFHVFVSSVYFMCIFGGIISDVWWGKFNTIFYLSIIYSIGSVIISIGAIPVIPIPPDVSLFIGLLLIALGSGGIKPCVSAFGGDQFKLPEQAAQIATFFSMFYFSINMGSFISTYVTPMLRIVHCFEDEDCYSFAFGVPAALMITSLVFFLIGKSTYTYVETSSENMLLRVTKCISNAITTKMRERKVNPQTNLLDYSVDKYGHELVRDIRILGRILILYLPLPFFWALFDQQGSSWTLQADSMEGNITIGSSNYVIEPDQIQSVNPLLILILISLFDGVFYPLLSKIGIRGPLQKLTIGGCLAGVSFLLSSILQFHIQSSPEKTVSTLWQVPQYLIITLGEVMFSVTGLSFSYEQAPESMKSIVTSFWHLTVAFGNLIVIFIKGVNIFESKAYEFLLFAVLMFVDMGIFVVLAHRYKKTSVSKVHSELESTEQIIPLKEDGSNL